MQVVHHRVVKVAPDRVDEHSRRFVDRDKPLVFVEDVEAALLVVPRDADAAGQPHLDRISAPHPTARLCHLAIDGDMPFPDQLLEPSARPPAESGEKVLVETSRSGRLDTERDVVAFFCEVAELAGHERVFPVLVCCVA